VKLLTQQKSASSN